MKRFNFPILLLVGFTTVVFTFILTLPNLGPKNPTASKDQSSPANQALNSPTIVIESKADRISPILQGATPGPIGPTSLLPTSPTYDTNNGAAPTLYGETNGTIGPPAGDCYTLMTATNKSKPNTLPITSLFVFSMAGTIMLFLFREIKNNRKNALWIYGGVAAIVLVLTGFCWGTICIF